MGTLYERTDVRVNFTRTEGIGGPDHERTAGVAIVNLLDILIVVALVAIVGTLFFAGLARALVTLLALWLGLIGAAIFGSLVSDLLRGAIPGIESWTAEIIGFLLTFAIIGALVVYLAVRSFRTLTARSGVRLQQRGGWPVLVLTIALSVVVSLASVTVIVELMSGRSTRYPRVRRRRSRPASTMKHNCGRQPRRSQPTSTTRQVPGFLAERRPCLPRMTDLSRQPGDSFLHVTRRA